ncbi:hypothetical protein Droror1_Dr00008553 [Drosera rotundifolia]
MSFTMNESEETKDDNASEEKNDDVEESDKKNDGIESEEESDCVEEEGHQYEGKCFDGYEDEKVEDDEEGKEVKVENKEDVANGE